MKVVESPFEAYAHIDHWRRQGLRIGLVPTMGALHDGHISLVRRSTDENDLTVASIFVNPTQFGPQEDFSRYPRTLEEDITKLRQARVDLVFVPTADFMYPPGFSTYVDPPAVGRVLEGVFRPDHYRGVVTVVLKLFSILPGQVAYFGQKDYQQYLVIRRMAEDLNLAIRVQCCDTVREFDGLALSSRNRYLNTEQRRQALCLWNSLCAAQQMLAQGNNDVATLEAAMCSRLYQDGADRVDYARVVDFETLETLQQVNQPAIALIAAHVGATRLIDNLILNPVSR